MKSRVLVVSLLAWMGSAPVAARAGWVIETRNIAIKGNGDRIDPEPATMQIAKGKVRLVQPNSISLIDYKKGQFTLLNPAREFFWTGTVDAYVTETVRNRKESAQQRFGKSTASQYEMPKLDESKLPSITVKKTDASETIAGHHAVKYVVESNGEPFQEMWIAEDLDVSADLNPKKFLDYQVKMNRAMLGRSAANFTALYRNEDYRKLHGKGFALRTITHHLAGGYERVVTDIRRADVAASEFDVPQSYRRVRLIDVFPAPEGS